MQREAACEIGELLPQNEPAAMQPRLERLILHAQHRARFFCRQPLNIAQHDRRPVDGRQRQDRAEHTPSKEREIAFKLSRTTDTCGDIRGMRVPETSHL